MVQAAEAAQAAAAAGGVNPNTLFSEADNAAAADALWARLSTLHDNGALIGCSHRCIGVDHATGDDGGDDDGGRAARRYGDDEEDLYKVVRVCWLRVGRA